MLYHYFNDGKMERSPLQKVSTKEMGLAQSPRNIGLADSACGE